MVLGHYRIYPIACDNFYSARREGSRASNVV